jgi:hypothetical protein
LYYSIFCERGCRVYLQFFALKSVCSISLAIPLILKPIDDHTSLSNDGIVPSVYTNWSAGTVNACIVCILYEDFPNPDEPTA